MSILVAAPPSVAEGRAALWRRSGVREGAMLALLPALISLVMLWPALSGQGVLASTDLVANEPIIGTTPPGQLGPPAVNPMLNDPVDQFIPWRLFARSELKAGRFPLWNPYNGLGVPLHANYQSAVLSPFNLLWLLLPPVWGLGFIIALKWAVLGAGVGFLLRRLGVSLPAALFGSVAGQLMGPVVGWLQWQHTEALAWLPWMLLGSLAWLEGRRPAWLLAFAAFVAAEMLAGHIETAFYSFALLGAFSLAIAISTVEPVRKTVQSLLALAGAGVLGFGIAAAQFMPLLGILTSTWQWVARAGQGTNLIPMPLPAALTLLSANGFGWADAYAGPTNWIEAGGYVGALTLLLAGLCAGTWVVSLRHVDRTMSPVARLRRAVSPHKTLFWVLTALTAASMTYGIPPLSLLRSLPGFSSSLNIRLISIADLSLVVLASFGLSNLLEHRYTWLANRGRVPVFAAGVFGVVGLVFLLGGWRIWTVSSQDVGDYTQAWRMWAGALFCAGAVLILLRLSGLLQPRTLAVLALCLILLDMVRTDWNFNPASPVSTFYPTNELTDFLSARGIDQRVAIDGPYGETNRLMPYRIADVRYYDPAVDNRYRIFVHILSPGTYTSPYADFPIHMLLDKPRADLLSLVGIKWLVATANLNPNEWQDQPERGAIYKPWINHNSFVVWENRFAKPYAYFASRIAVVPGEAQARQRMKDMTIGNIGEATIESPGESSDAAFPVGVSSASNNEPLSRAENSSVTSEANIPGRVKVTFTAERTRLLIVNESWANGWRAEVDGKPAPVYRANYIVQGIVVPPGKHTLVLSYDPPIFRVAVGISAASLLSWLALLAWLARGRVRRSTRQAPPEPVAP